MSDCQGCTLYFSDEDYYGCELNPLYEENKCPCIECIIKMICDTNCNEFIEFDKIQSK